MTFGGFGYGGSVVLVEENGGRVERRERVGKVKREDRLGDMGLNWAFRVRAGYGYEI